MGDEAGGMDPCECIWSHEMAMRRLLNLIRNQQDNCNDNECFETDMGGRSGQPAEHFMVMMSLFFVAALFLYMFRPRTQRTIDYATKPSNFDSGNGAPPPTST